MNVQVIGKELKKIFLNLLIVEDLVNVEDLLIVEGIVTVEGLSDA